MSLEFRFSFLPNHTLNLQFSSFSWVQVHCKLWLTWCPRADLSDHFGKLFMRRSTNFVKDDAPSFLPFFHQSSLNYNVFYSFMWLWAWWRYHHLVQPCQEESDLGRYDWHGLPGAGASNATLCENQSEGFTYFEIIFPSKHTHWIYCQHCSLNTDE